MAGTRGPQVSLLDRAAVDRMLADRTHWIFLATTADAHLAFDEIEAAVLNPHANTTLLMHPARGTLLLVKKTILPIDQLQLLLGRLGTEVPSRDTLLERDVFILA